MEYAIVLYFDSETENKINNLIIETANACGNTYMTDIHIPPHISISSIVADEEERVRLQFKELSTKIHKGNVCFASMGTFPPYVLFLAPVFTEYLLDASNVANQTMLQAGKAGDYGNYLPNQWVAHTTIATKLDAGQLNLAFARLQELFSAFGGTAEKIALARCNPYQELQCIALGEKQI